MLKFTCNLSMVLSVIVLFLNAGCQIDVNKDKKNIEQPRPQAQMLDSSLGLLGKGQLCGNLLVMGKVIKKEGEFQDIAAKLQIALCGQAEPRANAWKAVAVTFVSPVVYFRKATDSYIPTESSKATLRLNGRNEVSIMVDGKSVKIGQMVTPKSGFPIRLDGNVTAELIDKGAPYKVGSPKTADESERQIWITIK